MHPRAICLVADDGGEIAGFVIASEARSEEMPGHAGELEELYARDDRRREDVRRRLAEAAVAVLARRGAGLVHVVIDHAGPTESARALARAGLRARRRPVYAVPRRGAAQWPGDRRRAAAAC